MYRAPNSKGPFLHPLLLACQWIVAQEREQTDDNLTSLWLLPPNAPPHPPHTNELDHVAQPKGSALDGDCSLHLLDATA